MSSFVEFLIYTILAVLLYNSVYKKSNKKVHFDDIKLDNNLISMYDNVLKEHHYNEFLYKKQCISNDDHVTMKNGGVIYQGESRYGHKHGCGKMLYDEVVYEGLWENDTANGFGVLHNKNFTVSGYKQNNNYHGLVKIDGSMFSNSPIKNIDCIYDNGIQKSCFVVDNKQNIKFVIDENVRVVM